MLIPPKFPVINYNILLILFCSPYFASIPTTYLSIYLLTYANTIRKENPREGILLFGRNTYDIEVLYLTITKITKERARTQVLLEIKKKEEIKLKESEVSEGKELK